MNYPYNIIKIILMIVIGMVLTILPLPAMVVWFRPSWMLMILVFYLLMFPTEINLGIFWIVGLLMDLLTGTLLGLHAFLYTVIGYLMIRFLSRLPMFSLWQQSFLWVFISFIYFFIQYLMLGMIGQLPHTWEYWMPILFNAVLWPWLFLFLRSFFKLLYD
ncbi:MAG: rod shape-determining protein MreD [Gammaproteobacteria bacterium RIFOXYB2_FULL_38_6]|nr:MAG: rod shape-determining protein MreD [Gammaproteobacteria bacterium RIFOXYB2_FULL_38_6]